MEVIMKKLFLLLTLISTPITLFGMEMESTNSIPQNKMIIQIEQQKFKTQRKYAELSSTIKNSIEMTKFIDEAINSNTKKANIPIDSRTIHIPGITPEQWQLIAPLLKNVYQISLAPDEQEKKEREQNLYTALNDKTDIEIEKITYGADKLAIEPLLDVGLAVVKGKLIENFVQSESPENYNPFNLPHTLTSLLTTKIIEKAARVCCYKNITEITTLTGHTLNSITFCRGGSLYNLIIKLLNVHDKNNVKTLNSTLILDSDWTIALSPNMLAFVPDNISIELWDISDKDNNITLISTKDTNATDGVRSLALSSDGNMLAYASWNNDIKLWDISDRHNIILISTTATNATDGVRSLAFSSDGNILASISWKGEIMLWDISDRDNITLISTLTCTTSREIAFSLDDSALACASTFADTIELWNIPKEQSENLKKQCTLSQALLLHYAHKQNGIAICSHENTNLLNLYNSFDPETKKFIKPLIRETCNATNYLTVGSIGIAAVFILWKAWRGN